MLSVANGGKSKIHHESMADGMVGAILLINGGHVVKYAIIITIKS